MIQKIIPFCGIVVKVALLSLSTKIYNSLQGKFPASLLHCNNIVGIQVTLCDTVPLFIFGVYLPSNNVLDDYKANIDIMQGLYEQYCQYGKVLFAGYFNASLLREFHVNNAKSEILRNFVKRRALCTPMIDFRVEGEQFTFTPKETRIDYILFD